MPSDYPSQNAGKATSCKVHEKWRKSCLASPQLAGIPTTFQDGDTPQLDNWNAESLDLTGGVMDSRKKRRSRR